MSIFLCFEIFPFHCPTLYLPRRGVQVQFYSFFNLDARWARVVNAMPRPLYPQQSEPVPHSSGAWVCPRAQNLVPHCKCTCNHKYLFREAPPTRVGPYTPSSGKLSRRNTFIINAVQGVYMYSQNTLSFKILLKCRLLLFCIY